MYQSPFRIVDAATLPQEPEALRRALALEKKKLLAEFELAGTATVIIEGSELHRQDVIALFEELANEALLRYHRAIAQDHALLSFLEDGHIEGGRHWAQNPIYEEPGFLQFISPYFAAATDAAMQAALGDRLRLKDLKALADNRALRLPEDTEAAFRYATRFFTEKKNELLAIEYEVGNGTLGHADALSKWCTANQLQLLNMLPESFNALRYALANSLNNLCVAYDRRKAKFHALAAIEQAARIDVEEGELKALIPKNLRVIREKASRGFTKIDPKTGKKKPNTWLYIGILIFVVRIVAATRGCSGADEKPRVDYAPLQSKQIILPAMPGLQPPNGWREPDSIIQAITAADTAIQKPADALRNPISLSQYH